MASKPFTPSHLRTALDAMPKEPHPYEHWTDEKLLKELDAYAAKATQSDDVCIAWYRMPDGISHPQFETVTGRIAQDEGDYEFYAALRTAWPRLREALAKGIK